MRTFRRVVKGALASAVHRSGLQRAIRLVRRAQAGGRWVAIVAYHRVVEDFALEASRSIPGLLVSRSTLARQLEAAAKAGYQFASLSDALDVLSGKRRTRRDLLVVTFDDGYRDVYVHALPLLRRMGVPAVMYVATGYVGTTRRFVHDRLFHLLRLALARRFKPRYAEMPEGAQRLLEPVLRRRQAISEALDAFIAERPSATLEAVADALERELGGGPELLPEGGEVMSWDELLALANAGFELGAHTVGHVVLPHEHPERIDEEIRLSKEVLERKTGRPVHHFAYCNGWYSPEVVRALVRHGFRSAVTTEALPNRVGGDPFALKRKVLWENFSIGALGRYSPDLTACHLDDVFGFFGFSRPVSGVCAT